MNLSPDTRMSLLERLKDASDQTAWREFVRIYEPLVYRVARRRRLQDADAREVTQEVLLTVSRAIQQWQPAQIKGAFRAWLFQITRNLTINLLVKQQRHARGTGSTELVKMLDSIPEPPAAESAVFDEEYQRQLFRVAADRVRPAVQENTWQAFWRTCVEGETIQKVASELGMSVGSVYAARSRVTARLGEEIRRLEVT